MLKRLFKLFSFKKKQQDFFGRYSADKEKKEYIQEPPKRSFVLPSCVFYFPYDYFNHEYCFDKDIIYLVRGLHHSLFDEWIAQNHTKFTAEWQLEKGVHNPKKFVYLDNFISSNELESSVEIFGSYISSYINSSDRESFSKTLQKTFVENSLQTLFFEHFLGFKFSHHSGSGFLRYDDCFDNRYAFLYTRMDSMSSYEDMEYFLIQYLKDIEKSRGFFLYQLPPEQPEDKADLLFDKDMELLIDTVASQIQYIKEKGFLSILVQKVGIELLKNTIEWQSTSTPGLSRILVDQEMNIIFPEYNNICLELPPIEKALYLFFLKQPKPILLKHLINYKDEIFDIYIQNAYYDDLNKLKEHIERLLDTRDNSINEKLSKIKNNVLKCINPLVAHHYYITGKRGEGKSISLPKNMIIWEKT